MPFAGESSDCPQKPSLESCRGASAACRRPLIKVSPLMESASVGRSACPFSEPL